MGGPLFIGLASHAQTSFSRESTSSYVYRRYPDHILSFVVLGILAFIDLEFLLGGFRVKEGQSAVFVALLLNAALFLVAVVMLLRGRTRRGFRRYESGDEWVSLPFSRVEAPSRGTPFSNAPIIAFPHVPPGVWVRIPRRLPIAAVKAVSWEPPEKPPAAAYLVNVDLELPEPSGLESGGALISVVMRGDDFGPSNLRDFVPRVPTGRIRHGFLPK